MKDRLDRRHFLKTAALGATAALAGCGTDEEQAASSTPSGSPKPATPAPSGNAAPEPVDPTGASKVVTVRDPSVVAEGMVDPDTLRAMLDRAMAEATGGADAPSAFADLFGADDVVAIKVNCIAKFALSTSPVTCGVVVEALLEAGVKPGNVVVFDRDAGELDGAGFDLSDSAGAPRIVGTNGAYGKEISYGQFKGRIARTLEEATALINMPILKDHGITQATFAMKNHYGSIDNPGRYHGNNGVPGIAEISATPEIKGLNRLVIMDATRGCLRGGPFPPADAVYAENALLVSTDPAALDAVAWDLLCQRRSEQGMANGPRPEWLAKAEEYGVGRTSPDGIDAVEV
ncbi:MAG: DUF362 domain-containing protein [Armatimonadia bacterium]|nr:DUF362 domain-containing protein [Armatimonadia bacterium]